MMPTADCAWYLKTSFIYYSAHCKNYSVTTLIVKHDETHLLKMVVYDTADRGQLSQSE